ncbi:MAG: ATP-binding protein [Gammaproteobacteria bacterium]
MRLKTQLLLLGLVVLVIPWGGCQFIREMEVVMRNSQEAATLATAQAAAGLAAQELSGRTAPAHTPIYAHDPVSPISLDGYDDDWQSLLHWARSLGDTASLTAVNDGSHLLLLVRVDDERTIYQRPGHAPETTDHIALSFQSDSPAPDGKILLVTSAPGWLAGQIRQADGGFRKEPRVRGEWQETVSGYNVEFRVPMAWARGGLAIDVFDSDVAGSAAHIGGTRGSARIIVSRTELGARLAAMASANQRLWALDAQGFVRARAGQLNVGTSTSTTVHGTWLAGLYGLLLTSPSDDISKRVSRMPRLSGPEIDSALAGQAASKWWRTNYRERAIVSAAYPVRRDGNVIGVAVAEETAGAIALFTGQAVTRLFNLTLAAMIAVTLVLLAYATYLSLRIRKLRDAAEHAISAEGHIKDDLPLAKSRDELGDLSRSYASLLRDLREYTDYLRSLASKLSHELRTPLAIVQSSIDNLRSEPLTHTAKTYADRAQAGTRRLNAIINAMSEASRVEQAVKNAEQEHFALRDVVSGCAEAYKDVYSNRHIESLFDESDCKITGVPELIAQLLDKLVDNAVDFSPEQGHIAISLHRSGTAAELSVSNEGEPLPEQMRGRLFDSLVSLRANRDESRPHLGLGLYISRLIVEFHGGSLRAENLANRSGVAFSATFPLVAT